MRRNRREKELTHAQVSAAAGISAHTLIDIEMLRVHITKGCFESIQAALDSLPGKAKETDRLSLFLNQ